MSNIAALSAVAALINGTVLQEYKPMANKPGKGFAKRQRIKAATANTKSEAHEAMRHLPTFIPGSFGGKHDGEYFGYIETHHLLERKEPPNSVVRLRERLQRPEHKDIHDAGIKGVDFADCLGIIAAKLDIALDGNYDVPDLCDLLVRAMDARDTLGNNPSALDERLVSAELIEREGTLSLEEGFGTVAPAPVTPRMQFMQEQGCEVCENINACMTAKQCLGGDL